MTTRLWRSQQAHRGGGRYQRWFPVVEEDRTCAGLVSEFDLLRVMDAGQDLGQVALNGQPDTRHRHGHGRDAGQGCGPSASKAAIFLVPVVKARLS